MSNFMNIFTINWVQVAVGLALLLFVTKDIISLFSYFKNLFGIHTKGEDNQSDVDKRLERLERHDKDKDEKFDKILDKVDKLNDDLLDYCVESYRFEILDMASAISQGRDYNRESMEHCLKIYEKYEKILEENHMSNGQVDISIQVIKDTYKEKLMNGF